MAVRSWVTLPYITWCIHLHLLAWKWDSPHRITALVVVPRIVLRGVVLCLLCRGKLVQIVVMVGFFLGVEILLIAKPLIPAHKWITNMVFKQIFSTSLLFLQIHGGTIQVIDDLCMIITNSNCDIKGQQQRFNSIVKLYQSLKCIQCLSFFVDLGVM